MAAPSARRHAASGTAWTVGGYAAMQGLRFGFNLILARLVAPDVFGVMALVNLFVQGLQMFSDLGIRQCVVQHPRGHDRDFLDTAWTFQVLRGAVLSLASALIAGPLAAFYGEPALRWLVPLSGASALVTSFGSTAILTLNRHVRRGPLVRMEVGVYLVTMLLTLAGLWAVVRYLPPGDERRLWQCGVTAGGAVFAGLCEVAVSYRLPGAVRPRFRWDAEARGQLVHFGGWVYLSTACTFLASQADRMVVGKLSLDTLGVYHVAAALAALPAALLVALGNSLVFPLYSRELREGRPLGPVFKRAHGAVTAAAGLLVTGAACAGPALVECVYDSRYHGAGLFLSLLSVAAWFTALQNAGELALLAHGKPRCLAVAQAARLLALPPLLLLGYHWGGVPGLVLGVAGGELVRYLVTGAFASRVGVPVWRHDLRMTLLAGAAVAVTLAAERGLWGHLGPWPRFALTGSFLVLVWAPVIVAVLGWRKEPAAVLAGEAA